MWMTDYSDGAGEFNMEADSFNGRKLRPLIPRTPVPSSTNNITCSNSSPPSTLSCLHGTADHHLFSLNHHLVAMADQSKKEFHSQPVVVSSRWNPTPEQLRTLEELYRRGTRTPSAEQIQHITAQLRRYGKIEGKNVFYWFQNHKARERQKRRRQMESTLPDHDHHHQQQENFERKDSGGNRTGYEGHEQTKNWPPYTNCSTLPEEAISIQRATKAAAPECRDGWIQFDQVAFEHRRSFVERNATWQMMQLSCPSSPTHHINTGSTTLNATTTTSSTTLRAPPASAFAATTITPPILKTMDQKLVKSPHDLNIFITPYYRENEHGFLCNNNGHVIDEEEDDNIGCGESQTLQLFPLRSSGGDGGDCGGGGDESINDKETKTSAAMNANFSPPYQFFEFLPLKN